MDEVLTVIAPNSSISSTLIAAVDSTKAVYSISFKIYFSRPYGSTSVNATNNPSYEYTWIKNGRVESREGLQSKRSNTWTETTRIYAPENGKR